MSAITLGVLRENLLYSPETGFFTWLVVKRPGQAVGDVAGSVNKAGYRVIQLDGRIYKAHRLAWLYVHGVWPANTIDHINGAKSDNRIANIREATCQQNGANRRGPNRNATCGIRGVYWSKAHSRWKASIGHENKRRFLGLFASKDDAANAYNAAAAILYGEFYKNGLAGMAQG